MGSNSGEKQKSFNNESPRFETKLRDEPSLPKTRVVKPKKKKKNGRGLDMSSGRLPYYL